MTIGVAAGDRGSVTVWTLGMVLVVMFLGAISLRPVERLRNPPRLRRRRRPGRPGRRERARRNPVPVDRRRKLDPARAEALASDNLAAQDLDGVTAVDIDATADQVVVELTATVDVGLAAHLRGWRPPRRPRPRRRTASRGHPMKHTAALVVSRIVLAVAACSGDDDAEPTSTTASTASSPPPPTTDPPTHDVCTDHDRGDHTSTPSTTSADHD